MFLFAELTAKSCIRRTGFPLKLFPSDGCSTEQNVSEYCNTWSGVMENAILPRPMSRGTWLFYCIHSIWLLCCLGLYMVCKSDGNHKDTISYFNNVVVCCFHESLNQKRHSGVFFLSKELSASIFSYLWQYIIKKKKVMNINKVKT